MRKTFLSTNPAFFQRLNPKQDCLIRRRWFLASIYSNKLRNNTRFKASLCLSLIKRQTDREYSTTNILNKLLSASVSKHTTTKDFSKIFQRKEIR